MKQPKGLSYSAISTWEQCQYKYMRMYDGGTEGKVDRAHSAQAVEGSLVHDVLERWHKDRKLDWKEILKTVIESKKNEYRDQQSLAYEAIKDNQFVGAWELLTQYMSRKDIYPNIINTEVPFEYILPNGVPVTGRIDRIDDLGNDVYGLVDYKSTRTYMYKSEIENSLQGMIYVLVSRRLFPKAKGFKFTIDALRFSPVTVEFSEQKLEGALNYLETIYDLICKTNTEDAKPRLNKFCGYCQLQESCPLMKKLKEKEIPATDYEGREALPSVERMLRDHVYISELSDIIEKIKQRSLNEIDTHLVELGVNELNVGGVRAFYDKTRYGNPVLKIDAN